jgi:hypothetical protein
MLLFGGTWLKRGVQEFFPEWRPYLWNIVPVEVVGFLATPMTIEIDGLREAFFAQMNFPHCLNIGNAVSTGGL